MIFGEFFLFRTVEKDDFLFTKVAGCRNCASLP